MLATRFTELVGCRIPIQQAGMGGTAGPELAVAVAEAGGLGMLGGVIYAGESVGAIQRIAPAASIVQEFTTEAERCLQHLSLIHI